MAFRVNIPPATRFFLFSLLALSLLYNIARWREITRFPTVRPSIPYLTVVPSTFLFYPWTLVTATLVEQNIFTVLLSATAFFYGGKYLERAWGSREFIKFIATVSMIPNAIAIPIYILWAIAVSNPERGFTQICGGISIQASFLVVFKQLVPEHTVTIFKGFVRIRVKHFPGIFLLLYTVSGVAFGTDTTAILAWLGLLTSWTYLRFFKRQPDLTGTSTSGLGVKGDASETFTFASLFPDVIQPPITFVSNRIYFILVLLKICTPFSDEDIASGNQQATARRDAGLPSLLNNRVGGGKWIGKREEAERRRALALKALDHRLQTAAVGRSQPQPLAEQQQSSAFRAATPVAPEGQSILGGTNYTPDTA